VSYDDYAVLTAQVAALKAENGRLRAPVSEYELAPYGLLIEDGDGHKRWLVDPQQVNALLAARAGEGGCMATGAELIAAERQRQIEVKGWTPEHDDEHQNNQLSRAGACYAFQCKKGDKRYPPFGWPWGAEWWKPSPDPIRNLVKAGALIAAEIDRLQRNG
jgi:hypothetical protein